MFQLFAAIGKPEIGAVLAQTFEMIGVVEEEITKAMKRHPKQAEFIWNSYKLFGDEAARFAQYQTWHTCWRAHVRELLDRIGDPPSTKEARDLGTKAEALIVFSECSLKAPLTEDGTYSMAELFQEVIGAERLKQVWNNEGMDMGADVALRESWDGARRELILLARKKLSRDYHFPTQEEVDARRAEDLKRGNPMPWMEYTPLPPTQVGFSLQVETTKIEKEKVAVRKPKEKPTHVQNPLF